MNNCPKCGAWLAPGTQVCPQCGMPVAAPSAANANQRCNGWALAGVALAIVLALLCLITAFMDSSNFINRLYTTAVMWNIPLVTIVLVVIGFVKSESKVLSYVSIVLLVAAFFCSNITKNSVQDVVSNVDNYVDVAAEAVPTIMKDARNWEKRLENAVNPQNFMDYDDYD